jgi:hypothetical protein
MRADVKVGDILVRSIGWGHDVFYQITKRTEKTVKVTRLDYKPVNRSIKFQTKSIVPIKNKFVLDSQYSFFTLKLHDNGDIGPNKRMIGWGVWNGKKIDQWSS